MSDDIIDQLFQKAIQLSGTDRDAFLNQLSEEAREKIERLLAADASAENHGLYKPPAGVLALHCSNRKRTLTLNPQPDSTARTTVSHQLIPQRRAVGVSPVIFLRYGFE